MNPSPRRYLSPEHAIHPLGQKFPIGARVRSSRTGEVGTVIGSYAKHCMGSFKEGSQDLKSYTLYVDGVGTRAWFDESELELVDAPYREQVRRLVEALCESIESGVPLPDNVRKALDPLLPNLTDLAGSLSHVEGDSVEIIQKMRDEW